MAFQILHEDKRADRGMGGLTGIARLGARIDFRWKRRAGLYAMMVPRLREKNGLTPERLFAKYAQRLRRTYRKATARIVERVLYEMTDEGRRLAASLRPVIPRDEYAIIHAGEVGGDIATALELLLDLRARTRRIVKATLRLYGTILVYAGLIFGTLYIMANYAIRPLEAFAKMSGGAPSSSQIWLMAATAWISGWGPTIVASLFALFVALTIASLTRLTGPVRVKLERFPPWSTYRAIQGYVWLATYIILVRAGRPETQVLEEQAERASPWLRERLSAIAELMGLHAKLFPVALEESGFHFPSPDMIDDIGNAWGGDDDAYERLLRSSRTWADEIEESALWRAETMKGVGMIVMYVLVAMLGLAINDFVPINL